MHAKLLLAVALAVAGASGAEAQQRRSVALIVGQPGPVGLLWRVSSGLALRSDVAFTTFRNERQGLVTESWSVTGGVSVLLNVVRMDSLRAYFAPRFSYRKTGPHQGSSTYAVDGAFGAEHELSRRVGVFGEAGLRYSHTSQRIVDPGGNVVPAGRTTSWSATGGVGLALYLR